MGYELRTNVVEPVRNTFSYLVERFGDRPATRYQEASFDVQPKENFHYRPTWDPDHELYDPDFSALKLTDPYGYTDPRQYYYTPYVANASDRYESFAQTLKYIEDRRLLDKLPEAWHTVLTGFVLPLRHYEQGAQLINTNASRFGYGTTITQAACFASFDRLGNAQLLSLIGLALAGGGAAVRRAVPKHRRVAPRADRDPYDQPVQQVLRRAAQLRADARPGVVPQRAEVVLRRRPFGGTVRVPDRDLVQLRVLRDEPAVRAVHERRHKATGGVRSPLLKA